MRNAPDKNPFKGVSDLLSRAAPAKRNLHFLSYIIDFFLVAIVSYLLFLGGYAITTNSGDYKKNYTNYENEVTYYQDMLVDAHLAVYLDRDNHLIADDEDLSINIAISQIILSYSHDNPLSPEFVEDPLPKLKEIYTGSFYTDRFTKAHFDNDYISQFIIDYVPLHNENNELINFYGVDPKAYAISVYKGHVVNYESIKLIYSSDDSELPYLRPDVANDIYKFLIREKGYTRNTYDAFVDFYSSMLMDCEDIVFQAPSYQNTHYQDYLKYRNYTVTATDITIIISIFLSYYLAVFIPQMIFKDGRSFGRIFLRLAYINTDKSEVEIWKIIVRSFFSALSHLYIAFFLVLLPPFNGASSILYLPFFPIGNFDVTLLSIVIVVFALSSITGIVMLLTHEKRNILDLSFKTMVVDVSVLDEPDYDEKSEANI